MRKPIEVSEETYAELVALKRTIRGNYTDAKLESFDTVIRRLLHPEVEEVVR